MILQLPGKRPTIYTNVHVTLTSLVKNHLLNNSVHQNKVQTRFDPEILPSSTQRICHKSWLSKADFTWLILMSHKVCGIPHYDVTGLIVLTWLGTREELLYYDWLIVSWLTIVTSYGVMTFAHDSYNESWVSRMWLVWAHELVYEFWLVNGMLWDDSYESSMDFTL